MSWLLKRWLLLFSPTDPPEFEKGVWLFKVLQFLLFYCPYRYMKCYIISILVLVLYWCQLQCATTCWNLDICFPFSSFFLEVNHVALFQRCMLSLNFACVSSQKASDISVMFQTVRDGVMSRMLFINDYAWKKCSLQHYHQSPPLVKKLTLEHCVVDVKVMPAL